MMRGRIIEEHKTNYLVESGGANYIGTVRGKFHAENEDASYPKVGDFVEITETSEGQVAIENVLPRRSVIARKIAGGTGEQVIVANVDLIFAVMGLDGDFNLRRIERYMYLANQSKVQMVVILNKSDLVSDTESYVAQVREVAPDVPIYCVSAATGANMDVFKKHIHEDTTAVLLGSSGAGKSTIMNWLLGGDIQSTNAVRGDDDMGRHTTTSRRMLAIPTGGFLIDTPGMRELGVLAEDDGSQTFTDIAELMSACKYADCDHVKSEGCAVTAALASGALDEKRYQSYLKLTREREYIAGKASDAVVRERKQTDRKIHAGRAKIQRHNRAKRQP